MKNSELYAGEGQLVSIEDCSPAWRLTKGLQWRRLGASTALFQAELDAFDAADLAGKRAMLAEYWPRWESVITASPHKLS